MFGNRPVIGVTGPEAGGLGAWIFTSLSVRLAGGKPLRITPKKNSSIEALDGLILGGGADVSPEHYDEDKIDTEDFKKGGRSFIEWIFTILLFPVYFLIRYFLSTKTSPEDPMRDEVEFGLLKEAIQQKKPVLGICRGMQLINIHFKGSLHQDISNYYAETPQVATVFPRKKITIKSGSVLEQIFSTTSCKVNALHNQAIKVPGEGIVLIAREEATEIVQGIEHEEYSCILGVQWHPEYLIQIKRQRKIFKFLVSEAKKHI